MTAFKQLVADSSSASPTICPDEQKAPVFDRGFFVIRALLLIPAGPQCRRACENWPHCVANIPGGVARASTLALTNATVPHILAIANKGAAKALTDDPHLRNGLNVHAGRVAHDGVARSIGKAFVEPLKAIAA